MKKFLVVLAICFAGLRAVADEGMWLPMLLGEQVYSDMVKKGLKLTKDQLYSINKPSIKDAVLIFGGYCTGEVVSNEGLLFTNHHCGYDVIASLSSVDKNMLRDGFWAKSKQEEVPAGDLYVEFLVRIEDVTTRVEDSLKGLSGSDRTAKLNAVIGRLNREFSDPDQSISARVAAMFKGNQFLLFVYQRYHDIRFVGAPPEALGKFGGDTDNWEWPRHSADFSAFRVYTGKKGEPAEYSADNIPMKPKHFLPISIKGLKDGEYTMTYGFPYRTNRYETSFGVKQKIDIFNPNVVKLRDMRLKYMMEEMKKDPAIRLQLSPEYAYVANYWKFYDGEMKQLVQYDIYNKKKQQEAAFLKWATGKPEYEQLFTDWQKTYDAFRPYSKLQVYMNEGILGSPLLAFAGSLQQVENAIVKKGNSADIKAAIEAVSQSRASFLKSENKTSDQNIVATVLRMFYTDIDKNQHPIGFYEGLKGSFGDLKDEQTFRKYAANVFSNTMIFDEARWSAFSRNPDATVLQADPAYATVIAFLRNWQGKFLPQLQQFNAKNLDFGRVYLKGIREMDPVKAKKTYPDANSTMRVSFGNVKGYQPRDAVRYDYITTMKGVIEKYKPGDFEFDLPASVRDIAQKKDFGQYIDKQRNDLVVGFITTNDITGGNSGSPVIDGSGNLVGLAFDGNYEALSHQISFDKDLNRTICVDIRYVLWCIDKLGGASNIIKELKIVK